jgi:two-component system, NarL family, response regulator LiaR
VKAKIRLLIVDDYPVVLSGLIAMFKNHEDLEVVGVASNGAKAVDLAVSLRPNVVIMNRLMPEMDGVEATQAIKKNTPDVNIIIFSGLSTHDMVVPALKAGAIGYIIKDASEVELIQAVRQAARGEACLHPSIMRHVLSQMHNSEKEEQEDSLKRLTERELSVLKLMAQGFTNQEIAQKMRVSTATVHSHVGHILSKLQVSSRTQAAIYAMRAGIVNMPDD